MTVTIKTDKNAKGPQSAVMFGAPAMFRTTKDFDWAAEVKALLPGVTEVRSSDHSVDIYADRGGTLIPGVVNAAQATGTVLSDVHIQEPSLETLFLHHTGRSLRD